MEELTTLMARPSELPPALALISIGFAFVFGACWGSFLNVVIARVPAGQSVVTPRSRCPKCKAQIGALDNLPVLSWLLLRGKCRSCAAPISWRYPFIEALIGLLAVALVLRHGYSLESLELFVFATVLTGIAFIDLDTWTVPHPMWIALVASGLGFAALRSYKHDTWELMIDRAAGAGASGLLLGAVIVLSTAIFRRTGRLAADQWAMGAGDPLILVGIGAFLGWQLVMLVVFLSSVQGAVVGVALKLRGGLVKGDHPVVEGDDWIPPKDALPFGPFLALGGIEAAFFGEAILALLGPLWGVSAGST